MSEVFKVIIDGCHTVEDAIFNYQLIAQKALAEIGWNDE